jgi:CBS domain containing-hemolysin-like protein
MTGPTAGLVAGAAAAYLVAALLSAGETGLLRLGRGSLADLAGPTPGGRRVARLAEDPHRAAGAAATARVVLEVLGAVLVTVALGVLGPWWQVAAAAVAVGGLAALVVVRHLPRRVGGRHPGPTVLATAGLLVAAQALAGWARVSSRTPDGRHDLSEEEIRDMVDRVSEAEEMAEDEREMFRSVLELGDTLTRAVMVPRTEMVTVPSGTQVHKAMSLFLRSGFSRVPLVGESVDDVLGVLYLKDLVRHRHLSPASDTDPVDPLARPAVFVPESKPVDDLLREMQHGSSHVALVVDEFGGIAGLVTMEDALEEIVGELTDEHDRSRPEVEAIDGGTFRVPARLPVDELGELFDLSLEDEDVDTAGGLLAKALGKVPLVGSRAVVGPLVLEAERVEGRRKQLATLIVQLAPEPGETQGSRP